MVSKLPRVGHEFLFEIYTHGSLRVIDFYILSFGNSLSYRLILIGNNAT